MKKRSVISWVLEFAGRKRAFFAGSVLLAMLGVAASFAPYLIIAGIVSELLSGNKDWSFYLTQTIIMGVCWILRVTLHSVSTSLSHIATFTVLGTIRKQVCEKLMEQDGIYKNFITGRKQAVSWKIA